MWYLLFQCTHIHTKQVRKFNICVVCWRYCKCRHIGISRQSQKCFGQLFSTTGVRIGSDTSYRDYGGSKISHGPVECRWSAVSYSSPSSETPHARNSSWPSTRTKDCLLRSTFRYLLFGSYLKCISIPMIYKKKYIDRLSILSPEI